MTYTISQTPTSVNYYIYPNGDNAVNLTPSAGSNYECIDEVWNNPNDDTDYVSTESTSNVTDVYNCPNPSLSGTINYVKHICRAKSYNIAQSASGNYKLSCYDGTTTYSENKAPLPTSYSNYYHNWATKPSGGAWTWTDINNLRLGIQCSSPLVTGVDTSTLTIRPNGDGGAHENLHKDGSAGDANNYQEVDETGTQDGDTSYVYVTWGGNIYKDLYALENPSGSGVITKIAVFAYMRETYGGHARVGIKIGGTEYWGDYESLTTSYAAYSKEWATNPFTSSAWTWTNINDLIAGIKLTSSTASGEETRCTQVYVVVTHIPDISPPIRTTQCYAVVNYTSSANTVTLPDPKNVDLSHSRNIKRKNLPSGNYVVYDAGRGSKTLTITGTETSAAYTDMNSLKTVCHYGAKVTIAGLDDTNLNTDYWVSDIQFGAGPGYPSNMYDYKLSLEEM